MRARPASREIFTQCERQTVNQVAKKDAQNAMREFVRDIPLQFLGQSCLQHSEALPSCSPLQSKLTRRLQGCSSLQALLHVQRPSPCSPDPATGALAVLVDSVLRSGPCVCRKCSRRRLAWRWDTGLWVGREDGPGHSTG
jgi:hypothetical protein